MKFDGERFGYVFAKTLRSVYLMDRDLICHLPTLTYYVLSLPHYMYYEVENPHENPDVPTFYNINSKVYHIVFSVADMRDMYREKVNRFPYSVITPTLANDNVKGEIEKVSSYRLDQKDQAEEITDEHLVTLDKYQQQFLGSFKPKPKETGDISSETLPVNKKKTTSSSSSIPNAESKQ